MRGSELDDFWTAQVPDAFVTGVIRGLFALRATLDDRMAEHGTREAVNVRGFHVRAKVEALVRDVAAVTGLAAVDVQNSSWNHVEINAGPLLLTTHGVPTPGRMVARTEYRRTLARSSAPTLFDDDDFAPETDRVYGMLLHSPYVSNVRGERPRHDLPGSLYLAFPGWDMESYVHRVNLFAQHANLVDELLPRAWDSAARARYRFAASHIAHERIRRTA